MNRKLVGFFLFVVQTLLITGLVLFCAIPFSCRNTVEGIQIVGGDYASPVLNDVSVLDSKTVVLTFSEKVNLTGFVVSRLLESTGISECNSEMPVLSSSLQNACGTESKISSSSITSEEGNQITILLNSKTETGKKYEIYGIVEDFIGNTLTFCIPFTGFNDRVPDILMTEIGTRYTTTSKTDKETKESKTYYKNEFIEFLALEDGNLSGLEIVSGYKTSSKKYVFPAVEVKKGEIFVVHLRAKGEGCISENEDNLDEATQLFSTPGIRDLWSTSTEKPLNEYNDVIAVKNSSNNQIIDAVMYQNNSLDEWPKNQEALAEEVAQAGFYESAEISEAASFQGITPSRSAHRTIAASIQEKLENGEEPDFPVSQEENTWSISTADPGTL